MAIRTGQAALDWAARQVTYPSRNWTGLCLMFTRMAFNVPAVWGNATLAWQHTKYRHTGTPPRGVPVWWTGGSKGYGHVAVSDGGGYVYSTDILRTGKVDRVSIAYLNKKWGNLTYRGWTEDINGYRVYTPPKPPVTTGVRGAYPLPTGHLFTTNPNRRRTLHDGTHYYNSTYTSLYQAKDRAAIKMIQREVGVIDTGYYGPLTVEGVKRYQRWLRNHPTAPVPLLVDGVVGPATWAAMTRRGKA